VFFELKHEIFRKSLPVKFHLFIQTPNLNTVEDREKEIKYRYYEKIC